MNVLSMRQTPYPGSEIVIEETLEPGANYNRYYASYQSEGLTIYGLLTVPYGEQPAEGWPAIVFNHGYIPPDVYRTTERYIAYVDWLARSGYIVFRIDYRGHDRSEGEASGAYGDPGYTADVLNAVAALQRFPQADPNRIGMWGHSMGGYLTLRAMVISPEIKAGVIWAGVVASYPDLLYRWRRPGSGTTPTPFPATSGTRRWRKNGSSCTAHQRRTRISGTASPPTPTWPISPARSSCITALLTIPSRWNFHKSSTSSCSKRAKRLNIMNTRGMTTTSRTHSEWPCSARSSSSTAI